MYLTLIFYFFFTCYGENWNDGVLRNEFLEVRYHNSVKGGPVWKSNIVIDDYFYFESNKYLTFNSNNILLTINSTIVPTIESDAVMKANDVRKRENYYLTTSMLIFRNNEDNKVYFKL